METVIATKDTQVDESRHLVAVDYDTRSNTVRYLSRREKVIVEVWIKTHSISACIKALEGLGKGWVVSYATIVRWLKRPHLMEYVVEQMKYKAIANSLTEDKWISEGIGYKDGVGVKSAMCGFFWKELGKALGYYREEGSKINLNQQINFVQGNGEQ